ncbi:MAG: hydrogen gas-evolving membrane-bound hydrogenase subunit E, partial [Bacteroidales bacterium]
TKLSIKAAILFLVIHSLYKATLFMVAGAIDKQTGTREISKLGGLYKRMPIITVAAIISLLSMSGLPPMLGFVGKELIYEAKVQVGGLGNLILVLGIASNVFLVWVSGMAAYRTFFGKERRGTMKKLEPGFAIWIGPLILSLASLALGLSPGRFGEMIVEPALIASRVEILDIKLKLWHGFNQVFFLSLATIVLGFILFFLSESLIPVLRKFNQKYLNFDFARGFSRMIDWILLFSKKKTDIVQHGYHRIYLMIIFLFSSILIFYQLYSTRGWQFSANFTDMPFYIILIALIIGLSAVFTTITRSRMAAVVFLGVSGYGVAMIYLMYGGIDLAITQILVETLTIILFVLVIRKLPKFKVLSRKAGRIRDLAIALFVGTAMTGLTIKADFLDINPTISKFFIENSLPEGFGKNVVNVILVDFRALDTLGEITVLTIAAVGVLALLKFKLK